MFTNNIFKTLMIAAPLLTMVWSCGSEKVVEEEAVTVASDTLILTAAKEKNAQLTTGTIGSGNAGNQLQLSGMIEVPPANKVMVTAPMGGYIQQLNLLPGQYVSRGQRLATIQNQEFIRLQENYLTAKAKLAQASAEYERQRNLNADKAGSDKALEAARAEVGVQQALMQSAAKQLQSININAASISAKNITGAAGVYAPISGTVSNVMESRGQYVNPADAIVEITNTGQIHLAMRVFEKDLSAIQPGQKFTAYTNNYPDVKYDGNIVLIDRVLDDTRSAMVHGELRRPDKALVPGTYMNVSINLESISGNTLPEGAIVTWDNKQYAFVKTASLTYAMQEVKLGARSGGQYIINNAADLQGKTIVLQNAYTLLMALKNVADE